MSAHARQDNHLDLFRRREEKLANRGKQCIIHRIALVWPVNGQIGDFFFDMDI